MTVDILYEYIQVQGTASSAKGSNKARTASPLILQFFLMHRSKTMTCFIFFSGTENDLASVCSALYGHIPPKHVVPRIVSFSFKFRLNEVAQDIHAICDPGNARSLPIQYLSSGF